MSGPITLAIAAANILRNRRGEDRAITIADLAGQLGVSHRACEDLIEQNIARFDFPLCASARGLFVPTHAAEVNHYMASLRARALKIFIRRRAVRAQARRAGFELRGMMFFDPPAAQGELFASPAMRASSRTAVQAGL